MNRSNKPPYRITISLALALAGSAILTGCGEALAPVREPPLAGADIGGEFALKGSKGQTVRWSDFAGRYRVVYFGYTFCPDICPTDMQRVAQALKQLKASDPDKAGRIVPLFISVDPARDTPEKVGEFARAFSDDVIGLTGSPEAIAAAAKAFKVYFGRGEALAAGGYLVDHTNIVYLFGPQGEPLATLPVDQGPEAVAAELKQWVS
jgi:protein SCO1/2